MSLIEKNKNMRLLRFSEYHLHFKFLSVVLAVVISKGLILTPADKLQRAATLYKCVRTSESGRVYLVFQQINSTWA